MCVNCDARRRTALIGFILGLGLALPLGFKMASVNENEPPVTRSQRERELGRALLQAEQRLAAAEARPIEAKRKGARVSLSGEHRDLADYLRELSRAAGINIVLAPGIREDVSLTLRDVPWRTALEVLTRRTRCEVEVVDPRILLVTQPRRVSLNFCDGDAWTCLQLIAAYSGKNVIREANLPRRSVPVSLVDVRWDRAIEAIAAAAGYRLVREDENLFRVMAR